MGSCSHPDFEAQVSVRLGEKDSGEDIHSFAADVRVRCVACGARSGSAALTWACYPDCPACSVDEHAHDLRALADHDEIEPLTAESSAHRPDFYFRGEDELVWHIAGPGSYGIWRGLCGVEVRDIVRGHAGIPPLADNESICTRCREARKT